MQRQERVHRSVRVKSIDQPDGDLSVEAGRYKVSKQRRADGVEGQGGEQLMFSIKDVKKLRQSLELNETIKQSINRYNQRKNSVRNTIGAYVLVSPLITVVCVYR